MSSTILSNNVGTFVKAWERTITLGVPSAPFYVPFVSTEGCKVISNQSVHRLVGCPGHIMRWLSSLHRNG